MYVIWSIIYASSTLVNAVGAVESFTIANTFSAWPVDVVGLSLDQ